MTLTRQHLVVLRVIGRGSACNIKECVEGWGAGKLRIISRQCLCIGAKGLLSYLFSLDIEKHFLKDCTYFLPLKQN